MSQPKTKLKSPEKTACAAAVVTAAGAVICGVCCVLPIALPVVAMAGAGSVFAWIGRGQTWMTDGATVIVVIAWAWIALQSFRSGARPARATIYCMLVATVVLALAFLWPTIESRLVRAMA